GPPEGQGDGRVEAFPLGEREICERLQIPQRLSGREAQVSALLDSFNRMAACGQPACALVTGYAGIGKSSLVHELRADVAARRGYFIVGKFDQFALGVPYATLSEAFGALAQQLLTEPETRLSAWRERLHHALGGNGRLLVDL